eukprot:2931383-Prymnesium_polylepis.2
MAQASPSRAGWPARIAARARGSRRSPWARPSASRSSRGTTRALERRVGRSSRLLPTVRPAVRIPPRDAPKRGRRNPLNHGFIVATIARSPACASKMTGHDSLSPRVRTTASLSSARLGPTCGSAHTQQSSPSTQSNQMHWSCARRPWGQPHCLLFIASTGWTLCYSARTFDLVEAMSHQ